MIRYCCERGDRAGALVLLTADATIEHDWTTLRFEGRQVFSGPRWVDVSLLDFDEAAMHPDDLADCVKATKARPIQ